MSRKRRSDAIAQAQLFYYRGSDGIAVNTRFISRLNLLPFATIYLNCHLESSGHASFHNGIYVGCTFEFYGSNFAPGRFFDCDIYLKPFLTNFQGRSVYPFGFADATSRGGVCIDTRFHRSRELIEHNVAVEISWDRVPQAPTTRGYQHNVTLDGEPYVIQPATPGATVILEAGSDLLKAFKIEYGGKTYYNIPNLTGRDPFGYGDIIKKAALADGKAENYYLAIPVAASLKVIDSDTIRSGQSTATLACQALPESSAASGALGRWQFAASEPALVEITPGSGGTITVSGRNDSDEPADVIIVARNELGIEAAAKLRVEPAYVEAPAFKEPPVIQPPAGGYVRLDYRLDSSLSSADHMADQSRIEWYRGADPQGTRLLKVAVSRFDKPETVYRLSPGDIGHYLAAAIAPKHKLSDAGPVVTVVSAFKVKADDVLDPSINTDFRSFPTDPQPEIIPGAWTLDGYLAPECVDSQGVPRYRPTPDSWTYSAGEAGSRGYFGLNQTSGGARLFYTPPVGVYGDMTIRAGFAPDKNAGQGFGSATNQFLDVYVKFDLGTMTGYALRIERLSVDDIEAIGFDSAGAVAGCAFFLVEYKNGTAAAISEKIMSSAFLTECTVTLTAQAGRLRALVSSTAENRAGDRYGYPREVHFDIPIEGNSHGGTGMLFTGTVGPGSVLVTRWETRW